MPLTIRILSLIIVAILAGCVTEPVMTPTKVYATRPAIEQWTLDNDSSRLSFVSVKAGNIGEVHKFSRLNGELSRSGELSIIIDLASVDTGIPIRDERMREFLFQTNRFPTATLNAQVAMDSALVEGNSATTTFDAVLSLNGVTLNLAPEVTVARVGDNQLLVTSSKPILLNADSVSFGAGLEKLREIAALPSISNAVPVSFVLVFTGQ